MVRTIHHWSTSPVLLNDFKNVYIVFVPDHSCTAILEVGKAPVRALPWRWLKPERSHVSTTEEVWSNLTSLLLPHKGQQGRILCSVQTCKDPGAADSTVLYWTLCCLGYFLGSPCRWWQSWLNNHICLNQLTSLLPMWYWPVEDTFPDISERILETRRTNGCRIISAVFIRQ